MLEALQAFSADYPFTVEVIDVDGDEDALAQFDELVPVLFARRDEGDGVRLCHYFLDDARVRAYLNGEAVQDSPA